MSVDGLFLRAAASFLTKVLETDFLTVEAVAPSAFPVGVARPFRRSPADLLAPTDFVPVAGELVVFLPDSGDFFFFFSSTAFPFSFSLSLSFSAGVSFSVLASLSSASGTGCFSGATKIVESHSVSVLSSSSSSSSFPSFATYGETQKQA